MAFGIVKSAAGGVLSGGGGRNANFGNVNFGNRAAAAVWLGRGKGNKSQALAACRADLTAKQVGNQLGSVLGDHRMKQHEATVEAARDYLSTNPAPPTAPPPPKPPISVARARSSRCRAGSCKAWRTPRLCWPTGARSRRPASLPRGREGTRTSLRSANGSAPSRHLGSEPRGSGGRPCSCTCSGHGRCRTCSRPLAGTTCTGCWGTRRRR